KAVTSSGAVISEGGEATPAESDDRVVIDLPSQHYSIKTIASASRAALASTHGGDLQTIGIVSSGLLAILILLLSVFMPKRSERNNPVEEIERALKNGEFIPYFQ